LVGLLLCIDILSIFWQRIQNNEKKQQEYKAHFVTKKIITKKINYRNKLKLTTSTTNKHF